MLNPLLNLVLNPLLNLCKTPAEPMCFRTPLYPHGFRTR